MFNSRERGKWGQLKFVAGSTTKDAKVTPEEKRDTVSAREANP
jgi:hypothetical protein